MNMFAVDKMKRRKGRKKTVKNVVNMKRWIAYAAAAILIAAGLMVLNYLPAKVAEKQPEKQISNLCTNFTDGLSCDKAVNDWEGKIKGSEAYAVTDYVSDEKSAFKEGWIIYLRLNEPLPIPGTNRTTMRIGMLSDKNSDSSQIYEFVE